MTWSVAKRYSIVAVSLLNVPAIASAGEPPLESSQLPAPVPIVKTGDSQLFYLDEVPVSRAGILGDSRILGEGVDAQGIVVFFVTKPSLCWTLLDEIFEYHAMISSASLPVQVELAIVLDAESQEVAEHWYNSTDLGVPVITGVQPSAMEPLSRYQDQEFQSQLVVYDARDERLLLRAALRTLTLAQYKRPVVDAVVKLVSAGQDHAVDPQAGGRE